MLSSSACPAGVSPSDARQPLFPRLSSPHFFFFFSFFLSFSLAAGHGHALRQRPAPVLEAARLDRPADAAGTGLEAGGGPRLRCPVCRQGARARQTCAPTAALAAAARRPLPPRPTAASLRLPCLHPQQQPPPLGGSGGSGAISASGSGAAGDAIGGAASGSIAGAASGGSFTGAASGGYGSGDAFINPMMQQVGAVRVLAARRVPGLAAVVGWRWLEVEGTARGGGSCRWQRRRSLSSSSL